MSEKYIGGFKIKSVTLRGDLARTKVNHFIDSIEITQYFLVKKTDESIMSKLIEDGMIIKRESKNYIYCINGMGIKQETLHTIITGLNETARRYFEKQINP